MSFHTLTATKKITRDDYLKIKEALIKLIKKKKSNIFTKGKYNKVGIGNEDALRVDLGIRTDILKDKGIIIDLIDFKEVSGCFVSPLYYGIMVKLNPARLFNEGDFINITTSKDVEQLFLMANRELKNISYFIPNFEEFSLKRIDFSFNIFFEDNRIVEQYMDLFYKARVPKGFNLMFYGNRNGFKASQKSLTFAVYNKYAQMKNQSHYFNNPDDGKGILRFEVQAEYLKIYNIKKDNELFNIKEFLSESDVLAKELFFYYSRNFFFEGDYYKLTIAREKIQKSDIRPKIKKRMIYLLELTNIRRSLSKAIKEMKDTHKLSNNQINLCINYFNSINVNPVTIPKRYHGEKLINPLKFITIE